MNGDRLTQSGWSCEAMARGEETAASVSERGALGLAADASDPDALSDAHAVAAARPPEDDTGFGGGPIADATIDGFRGWAAAVAEQAFVFLSTGIRALREGGAGGTLIQVTGGSARRAMPGRGIWSAGAQASRAVTQAAAQEVRAEGIHVALLVVAPRSSRRRRRTSPAVLRAKRWPTWSWSPTPSSSSRDGSRAPTRTS